MGLFKKMKDPVQGTAKVTSASFLTGLSDSHLRLVVTADGVPPTAVEVKTSRHGDRWPNEGDTIPVTVDRANPQNFEIEWSAVQRVDDRTRQREERATQAALSEARGEGADEGEDESIADTRRMWRENLEAGYCTQEEFDRQMRILDEA